MDVTDDFEGESEDINWHVNKSQNYSEQGNKYKSYEEKDIFNHLKTNDFEGYGTVS